MAVATDVFRVLKPGGTPVARADHPHSAPRSKGRDPFRRVPFARYGVCGRAAWCVASTLANKKGLCRATNRGTAERRGLGWVQDEGGGRYHLNRINTPGGGGRKPGGYPACGTRNTTLQRVAWLEPFPPQVT